MAELTDKQRLARLETQVERAESDIQAMMSSHNELRDDIEATTARSEMRMREAMTAVHNELTEHSRADAVSFKEVGDTMRRVENAIATHAPWIKWAQWFFQLLAGATLLYIAMKVGLTK